MILQSIRSGHFSNQTPYILSFGHVSLIGDRLCNVLALPNHSGDLPEGSLRAILKEAGIDPNEFLKK